MSEPILLLARSIPPVPTGTAIIVGNLAKQFTRAEMVVAGEKPREQPPVAWREEWPELHHLYAAQPDHMPAGRRKRRLALPGIVRTARWRRRLALPGMVRDTLRLARERGCKKVVAVFPSEEFLWVGYQVARQLGADFYPYFHNTYLDNRSGLERWPAQWLQPRVFAAAKHVFVISQGMVDFYRERYPDLQCTALVHSFNEPLPEFVSPPPPGSPLRVALSGTINNTCSDAAVRVGAALQRIPDAHLTILSGTQKSVLRRLGLLRQRVELDTVSRDVLLARLSQADLVLLPHGFQGRLSAAEYQTIFPTKTIEYLICGRPILAHSPADCFLTRFLKQWECALVVEEGSVEALVAAVERLRGDGALRDRLVRNALRAAEQFQAARVSGELRRILF